MKRRRNEPRHAAFSFDNRYYPPLLITGILISAHLSFGILEGYSRTGAAILVAIAAELVMGRLTYGRWPHPASAYITGISVGILVRSPFLWPYALGEPDLDRVEVRPAPQGPASLEPVELRRQRAAVSRAGHACRC